MLVEDAAGAGCRITLEKMAVLGGDLFRFADIGGKREDVEELPDIAGGSGSGRGYPGFSAVTRYFLWSRALIWPRQ
jgi:hypothetical protein